jgi:hypothetical protein
MTCDETWPEPDNIREPFSFIHRLPDLKTGSVLTGGKGGIGHFINNSKKKAI